jgi:hypothetical protein
MYIPRNWEFGTLVKLRNFERGQGLNPPFGTPLSDVMEKTLSKGL